MLFVYLGSFENVLKFYDLGKKIECKLLLQCSRITAQILSYLNVRGYFNVTRK